MEVPVYRFHYREGGAPKTSPSGTSFTLVFASEGTGGESKGSKAGGGGPNGVAPAGCGESSNGLTGGFSLKGFNPGGLI